jgi:ornithine carbamoyltransferase
VKDADVIITDTWVSMGEEKEAKMRDKVFKQFQINSKLVKSAKPNYLFMHCLPAHRGFEVTTEIIDGKHSIVFDEAENRLHIQKAILYLLMK